MTTIIISTLVLFIAAIAIWNWIIRRSEFKAEFQSYWDQFNDSDACENAWEHYKASMHIHRMYLVKFPEIGCPDELTYRTAAIHALERALVSLYEKKDRISPSLFNDRALNIRAGITQLKMVGLSEEGLKALANTQVTS